MISQASLTVTAAANTKTYDGTTSAAARRRSLPVRSRRATQHPTGRKPTIARTSGTGKTLTPAGTVTDGNSGLNYAYTYTTVTTGVITSATTSGSFTSSPNPSLPGSDVTFTATLTNAIPGGPVLSGNVQFKTNGVPFGAPVAIDGSGLATLITNSLPHGSNTVTAEYAGDSNFQGSTNSVVQVVNTPPTTTNSNAGVSEDATLVLSVVKLRAKAKDADGDPISITAAGPTSANGPAGNVVLNTGAGTITYTPASGFVGSDSFTYTVSDNYGGTATATVYVTVTANSGLSPNVVGTPTYSNGIFRVTFAGIPGFAYTVQRAPTPAGSWSFYQSVTAGTNGLFLVTDPNPPSPSGYYRTVYP